MFSMDLHGHFVKVFSPPPMARRNGVKESNSKIDMVGLFFRVIETIASLARL